VGGYQYAHDYPGHISPQPLLPEQVEGARFYLPDDAEAELAQRLQEVRRAREVAEPGGGGQDGDVPRGKPRG
jgi:replication-associated recombination protein RarA